MRRLLTIALCTTTLASGAGTVQAGGFHGVDGRWIGCCGKAGGDFGRALPAQYYPYYPGYGYPTYPYYAPPPVIYSPPPVIYTPPPVAPGAAPAQSWYYCDEPKGYYPYVASCSRAWRQVPAGPPAPPKK